MPQHGIVAYPIEETYQVLEEKLSIANHGFYRPAYDHLDLEETSILLEMIKEKLIECNDLLQHLKPNIIKGLINPTFKSEADKLVKSLNAQLAVTPDSIKSQLSEFIDFSRLTFFASKPSLASARFLLTNLNTFKQFGALTKLKFNLFLDSLNRFLESATEDNSEIKMISETLKIDYFPVVANANYSWLLVMFLKMNATNVITLRNAIETMDIPALDRSLSHYQTRISMLRLSSNSEDEDDDDFQDAQSEFSANDSKIERSTNQLMDFIDSHSQESDKNSNELFLDAETELFGSSEVNSVPLANSTFVSSETHCKNETSGFYNLIQRLVHWFHYLILSIYKKIYDIKETTENTNMDIKEEGIKSISIEQESIISNTQEDVQIKTKTPVTTHRHSFYPKPKETKPNNPFLILSRTYSLT